MNLIESHRQLEVSAYLRLAAGGPASIFFDLGPFEIGLPSSFCKERGFFFCTPDGTEEADSRVKEIIAVSTKGLCTINVTSDNVLWDHVVLLDLVDGLALPEFFTLFRKPLPVCAPVVLVKNLLLALLGLLVCFSLIKKLIFLELESHLIDSSHVASSSCPCGA